MANRDLLGFLIDPKIGRSDYDRDFVAWTEDQSKRLRRGEWASVDRENLAEEIESLGKRDKSRLSSNLCVVLLHLLKLKYQPSKAKPGWRNSISEHRDRIARTLEQSPSLTSYAGEVLPAEYERALRKAIAETGLAKSAFPEVSPFSVMEILDSDFWPNGDG